MTAYLLELSFGPVQGFIASARRSRDLWAGSFILSEVARAAGKALLDEKVELIYSLPDRILKENSGENSNLSNVLLARVPKADAARVREIAGIAKKAAQARLERFAAEAWKAWSDAGVELRGDFWKCQIEDSIESYAAWAAIQGDDYRGAYVKLKKTFAARKNTRDFRPMPSPGSGLNGTGIPKSSFDGLRESVLPEGRKNFPARFGLSKGEQLDAMGCIKRVVGKQERFTALTRLAADGWLNTLGTDELARLNKAYEPLKGLDLATGANGNEGIYKAFPFDGGLLYPERLEVAKKDSKDNPEAVTALTALETVLRDLWRKHGRPCPYAVLVVADGDRMGKFVDQAQEADQHKRVSSAVAAFADKVPEIARQHRGHSVFNGGEDLTVMFPLAGVIEGARELSRVFEECMKPVVDELLNGKNDEDARPTLRVGAVICHVLEPLGVIRTLANAAEKYAKGEPGADRQGNALGLKLHIRAGHEIGVRIGFGDESGFQALTDWQAAYRGGKVPGRLAYDTRAIALNCKAIGVGADVAGAEFLRLLGRARQRGGGENIPEDICEKLIDRCKDLVAAADEKDPSGLVRLADELILARWLSATTIRDIGALEGGEK